MGRSKSDMTKIKIRTLIKSYFVSHRNREISSREIANWINDNPFGLKTNVHHNYVTQLLKVEHNKEGILGDIDILQTNPFIFIYTGE